MSDLFPPQLSEIPLAMTCGTFSTVTGNLGVCYFLFNSELQCGAMSPHSNIALGKKVLKELIM